MGGHGGLNILPQKKWNVYNFDNREKVAKDEQEAAKQEQIKQDLSRKHQSNLRLQQLRRSKHPDHLIQISTPNAQNDDTQSPSPAVVVEEEKAKPQDSNHMNLFEGIRIFDPIKIGEEGKKDEKKGKFWRESKKVKKEEVRVVGPEDEVYRVGYGVVGKGVKLPWYLEKKTKRSRKGSDSEESSDDCEVERVSKKTKKKSLEELREERVMRERVEKERERALVLGKAGRGSGFSGRRR